MGAAYFIALDNPNPGFDPFVNGKAIAREAQRLSRVASTLGLKTPDDYVSMSGDEAASMAEEFGTGDEIQAPPPEQWFDADEGLAWVAQLRAQLLSDARAVKDADAVLADLHEYERVLAQAKSLGAKWHLSVDF
jgi:hypothetical protein